jgi:selenocysteine-specific elongation factor
VRTVATAGHVDHGKSTLVLALTGTDPDRFPEEQARGLTIDLGFAFCALPSGAMVGFVDVPGHVRFLKNMLAGVGAIDHVLFVVAANEGWMPQSEEHLRILEVLGVRGGVVAITKADLVDDETLELVQLEVDERLAGTPLAEAPVLVCDGRSGRGVDDIARALDDALAAAPDARDTGRPRLWIDRVFAAKGAGTVVTGTLTRGHLATDAEVIVGEPPRSVRIRSVETAGTRIADGEPGTRVALNLVGVEHRELARGDAVVGPGQWHRATVVDVAVTGLPGVDVPTRARLQAYVGSGEHAVWFRALDERGRFARVRFDGPIPLAIGDRMVLRDPGQSTTIAGAEVLELDPTARAREAGAILELPLPERVLASRTWVDAPELARLVGGTDADAEVMLQGLVDTGHAVEVGSWFVTRATVEALRGDSTARIVEHHRRQPHDAGLDLALLAGQLGVTTDRLRAVLATVDDLEVAQGAVRHRSHASTSESPEAADAIAAFDRAPFAPPAPAEVAAPPELVRSLVRAGSLVDLEGVVFSASALALARERVVGALRDQGQLTVADVRDLLGSTRKYVLPIVGWLDRTGVTRRRGDDRLPGPTSGLEPAGDPAQD